MEIIIDSEFKDLIAPQTKEENETLEQSILENGFNKAYPLIVWKGENILVDGHHRFEICQKYNIEFEISEQEFDSREEVINYMVNIQLSRRNIDSNTRAYLIGRRYNIEKKPRRGEGGNSCHAKTDEKIALEFNTSPRTVRNDSEYYKSVEKVCETTNISRQELMKSATIKDINSLAKMSEEECLEAVEKLKSGETITRKAEGVFPLMVKLDKNTNKRLKSICGDSAQDYICKLINAEYERINI